MKVLDRVQPIGLLVLRVVLGIIMIAHGKGKVFGGLAKHMESVAGFGMPAWMGYLSAGTEFFGGILLIVGLLTPLVGLAVCIEMCVAVAKVHFKNGLVGPGGYEFPLILAASGFALIWFGAGPIALDGLLFRGKNGSRIGR